MALPRPCERAESRRAAGRGRGVPPQLPRPALPRGGPGRLWSPPARAGCRNVSQGLGQLPLRRLPGAEVGARRSRGGPEPAPEGGAGEAPAPEGLPAPGAASLRCPRRARAPLAPYSGELPQVSFCRSAAARATCPAVWPEPDRQELLHNHALPWGGFGFGSA